MADSKNGGFPGHDEGTNRPPNVPSNVFVSSGSTFAPLQSGNANPVNVKTDQGNTGKPEGGE